MILAHNHPEPDQISLFALNLLEDQELCALQSHLSECLQCRRQVRRVRQVVEILPHAAPVTEAPYRLKWQVLARLKIQSRMAEPEHFVRHRGSGN